MALQKELIKEKTIELLSAPPTESGWQDALAAAYTLAPVLRQYMEKNKTARDVAECNLNPYLLEDTLLKWICADEAVKVAFFANKTKSE